MEFGLEQGTSASTDNNRINKSMPISYVQNEKSKIVLEYIVNSHIGLFYTAIPVDF